MLTEPQRATRPADLAAGMSGDGSWARHIEMVVRSLQVRHSAVDPTLIKAAVEAEFAAYEATRIREFVPILVETRVHGRLCRQSAS